MIKHLHIIQHVAFEGPGHIARWAALRGVSVDTTILERGEPLPEVGGRDAVCLMGGPMSVHDTAAFPWLKDEQRWLGALIAEEIPVLGICLGAQLIAHVLGAPVTRNPQPEIGWMPVTFLDGHPDLTVLHWHGETFGLPDGSDWLARTAVCPHQAFRVGRCLGLQFHLEAGLDACERLIAHCSPELNHPAATVHAAGRIKTDATRHAPAAHAALETLLDGHFFESENPAPR